MIRTGKKFSKLALSRAINGDLSVEKPENAPDLIRLDLLASEQFPSYSRATLQNFIKSGFMKPYSRPSTLVPKDTKLNLNLPAPKQKKPKLKVIFENEFVLVVEKPAGLLSVAKGDYCPEPTLEDFGFIVHRLDRATSGVIILAKDEKTQKYLRSQFQNRKTKKIYFAVVSGTPKLHDARIDLPLARNLKRPTTFLVSPNGKPSETEYHTIKSNGKYSLLELHPLTGRTHQLRVHLKYLGTPILGDDVYGEDEKGRLYLHAYSLEITIPTANGRERKIFTSRVPDAFTKIVE
ncbi:RluA family pseudouridine synthase [Candidatus Saccharibacteria bacterium]|nr:RluA family pseudouridine synthase [Candidatus Saccharibacteria bacterium]